MELHTQPLIRLLNILVLLGSFAILAMISVEMLSDTIVFSETFILRFQFSMCCIFLVDFLVRLYFSPRRGMFFLRNFLFLVVSIPYLNIVDAFHLPVSHYEHIAIRLMPLVRGMYGIFIVISWMTRSRITNLFYSYITTLLAATYFASILFYSLERGVNPMVKNYWDAAITWGCMNVTTVGSDIFAVTRIGQLLSVFLAAAGMMMFPIFTAYVTSKFQEKRKTDE